MNTQWIGSLGRKMKIHGGPSRLKGPPRHERRSAECLAELLAHVNDEICISVRMYDRRENTLGIWSDTIGTGFADFMMSAEQ